MALKFLIVLGVLVACIAMPMPLVEADPFDGILGPLFSLLRIQGIVYCTPNGNIGANGTATPVFPNAVVQLQCGGNVVSTAVTNGSGLFSIILNPLRGLLSTLLSGCRVVVNTPLASCNATLPSVGSLVSELQSIGSSLIGQLSVDNLIPAGFTFNANVN